MDMLGNAISKNDMPAIEGINAFVHGFVAYESTAINVLNFAENNSISVIANAYAGFIWMFLESPEAPIKAAIFLKKCEAAESNSDSLFPRGTLHVQILRSWISDEIPKVLKLIEESIELYPRDVVLVKLYQYLAFNQGQLHSMLDIVKKVLPFCQDIAYIYGMIAFAYEQCKFFDEAEISARKALSMISKEPWAEHALAHVMLTKGRITEGLQFLEKASVNWIGLNSFMSTHLYWHLALFHISLNNFTKALEIYDLYVWGVAKDYSQDQINAVSLLTRLELAGCTDVGEHRWKDIGQYLLVRCHDTTQPFHSLHYLIGLSRAGYDNEANLLLQAIHERSVTAPEFVKLAWLNAAKPASIAIISWIKQDYHVTKINMKIALNYMQNIGGSNAQRDLFEQIYIDSVIKSGDYNLGLQLIEKRYEQDPENLILCRLKEGCVSKLH